MGNKGLVILGAGVEEKKQTNDEKERNCQLLLMINIFQ